LKIVITGPECSGKTTLVNGLKKHLEFGQVNEVAREYLQLRNNFYDVTSLYEIALLQRWEEKSKTDYPIVICDTDLLTIIIWKLEKYQIEDQNLINFWLASPTDMFFLCSPDMTWEYDPMRENPNDRDRLFTIYETYLQKFNQPYQILKGSKEDRLNQVMKYVQSL